MNQIYLLKKPMIIAHRGASAYAPENTLSAFQLALDQGADAIELDAKLTADGEIVVIHDPTLGRTTGMQGLVNSKTLGEIKKLDAGSYFSSQFAGETIPTLREVFEALGGRLFINVELTNYGSFEDGLAQKVGALAAEMNLVDWILFSSFDLRNLKQIKAYLPDAHTAILALQGFKGWWSRSFALRRVSPNFVHPYFTDATEAYIEKQHALNRQVNVWTINDPAEMIQMIHRGVDGLITDDPLTALRVRGSL